MKQFIDTMHAYAGTLSVGLVAALLFAMTACDSTGPSEADQRTPLTLSFQMASNSAKAAKSQSFSDAEGNTIEIDTAEVILREIEFERDDDDLECSSASSDASCEKIESGPVLVDIPLDAEQPSVALESSLPEGRWETVEFDVHKLERSDADDRAFLDSTGFPEGVSIRVTGTWLPNGGSAEAFMYVSDLNEEQEITFAPPIRVTADMPKNVTFRVDLNAWFRDGDGLLVNPRLANEDGGYEDLVENNIESSIEGFEDDDRDGAEDDGDGDDEDN